MTPGEKVKQEMQAFRVALPDLLRDHPGQWVVFIDGKVVDFYVDEESAYGAAIRAFGPHAGFVIAQVAGEKPQPVSARKNSTITA
ncbi:MAG: hypothetical protein HY905_11285 [Deltaproteobacteria bacterium]|nr:hypothetical protein [Deltaproteobacteria bacterium]